MILLVTPNQHAAECAAALQESTGEEIAVAESLRRTATLLRSESYVAVVLDQNLLETEPDEIETTMQHLGTAIPVQVNLAISGIDRLVREVRSAVQRRKREERVARQAALQTLHSELNQTLTALLLDCDLALQVPALPPAALEKLQSTQHLLKQLRAQLEGCVETV